MKLISFLYSDYIRKAESRLDSNPRDFWSFVAQHRTSSRLFLSTIQVYIYSQIYQKYWIAQQLNNLNGRVSISFLQNNMVCCFVYRQALILFYLKMSLHVVWRKQLRLKVCIRTPLANKLYKLGFSSDYSRKIAKYFKTTVTAR